MVGRGSEVIEEKVHVYVRCRPVVDGDATAEEEEGAGGGGLSTFLGGGLGGEAVPSLRTCVAEWDGGGSLLYRRPGAGPGDARAFSFSGVLGDRAGQADVYDACAARVVLPRAASSESPSPLARSFPPTARPRHRRTAPGAQVDAAARGFNGTVLAYGAVLESITGRRPAWDIFKPLYLA